MYVAYAQPGGDGSFARTIMFRPNGNRGHIAAATAVYTSYLLISAVPLLTDAPIKHNQRHDPYDSGCIWLLAFFSGANMIFLAPAITALAAAALVRQALAIRFGTRALSLEGLGALLVVFAVVPLSWPPRSCGLVRSHSTDPQRRLAIFRGPRVLGCASFMQQFFHNSFGPHLGPPVGTAPFTFVFHSQPVLKNWTPSSPLKPPVPLAIHHSLPSCPTKNTSTSP
jgi:hypothetical protein